MSAEQLNAFLGAASSDPALQDRLRHADPPAAASLAAACGFDVTVGDLVRYKARATTWELSDEELAVVVEWQQADQPYWWQLIWGC